MTPALRLAKGGWLLSVRVTPKSSRDHVTGIHTAADGAMSLAVKVTAPPDKGKANKAVIETLAKASGLPKSVFSIVSGQTERSKTILVTGNPAQLEALVTLKVNAGKEN